MYTNQTKKQLKTTYEQRKGNTHKETNVERKKNAKANFRAETDQ